MQKVLITIGLVFLIAGLLWPWLSKLPFGRLPGDVAIEGENTRFYFPWVSMLLVSIVLSLLISFFRR